MGVSLLDPDRDREPWVLPNRMRPDSDLQWRFPRTVLWAKPPLKAKRRRLSPQT